MNLKDLQCRRCVNCTHITLVSFPKHTPYVYIECPKLPRGYSNPKGVGFIFLYHPFSYECHEFIPKEDLPK